ncbi:MAG TPA: hypothetical protein VHB79_05170 [Polyangiaceae bacterium]|nr:hypothetical protein [Polyangiaceae bacterium]
MGSLARTAAAAACCGACFFVTACGGSTRHSGNDAAAGKDSASSGSNSTDGGGGSDPAPGDGGAAPLMPIDGFATSSPMASIGLWMGFDGNMLPVGIPSVPHDGSALHLSGKTHETGIDYFFHTGIPVERIWSSVRFWSQSDLPGTRLIVAIAGPEPSYFTDRAQGIAWPQELVMVGPEWRESVIDFSALGIGPDALSPHSEQFGAVHFIIEPNTAYDLWLDDFAGQPLYR